MHEFRGTGDSVYPRASGHAPSGEASRFAADARAGAFSPSLDLHRAGSWSSPATAATTPQSQAAPGGPPPSLAGNLRSAFPGRAQPKRTMTVDPSEFLLRSLPNEWGDEPSYAWPSMQNSAMRTDPAHGASALPRGNPLSRSQTLDVDAPVSGHAPFGPRTNFSLPGSAVGSPRLLPADDWAPPPRGLASPSDWPSQELDTSWLPPRAGAAPLMRGARPDAFMSLGTDVLSSSPDDEGALLHQQQNAEASVAMALGDDLAGTRKLSASPTSFSRLGAPGDPPVSPTRTDRELARQLRSLTLPNEAPGADAGVPGVRPRDTPPISSPPPFNGVRGPRADAFGRKPTRHHTLNLLDQSAPSAAPGTNAFPVLPSGPFGPEARSAVASPTGKYAGGSVFSPPYSPDVKQFVRDDPASFGMFAPQPSAQPLDASNLYFGTHAAASPRQGKADLNRPAWFGAPGTLRLGERTSDVPDFGVPEPNGAPFVPYGYGAPMLPGRDMRGRGFHDGAVATGALHSPSFEPYSRRHGSGRRNASEGRHERHRRHHHDDREHMHEFAGRFELHDVLGRMVEVSTDQHGSRLIQEKLDHCTQEERDLVFAELCPEARRLMTDVFGNYVIQKMLEYGSREQVHTLGQKLQGHVLSLSLGTYGCRVVQKAFEHVDAEQKVALSRELEPYVLDCVRDQNANHVIQKILERVPSAHLDFVSSAFAGHVPVLASHCYSCRVLQRIFAYCSEEQRRPLLEEMHQDTLRLMQDQYGNYVIQWVLQHGEPRDRIEIVHKTKTHLLQLARHKFASNVVEHVIEVAPPADLDDLLDELFSRVDPADAPAALALPESANAKLCVATVMMQDQYANYVLQRFLQVVQGEGRQRLIATIRPALQALRQLATPVSGPGAPSYTGAIRLPGGGHIGSKPLLTIERLIDQVSNAPDRPSNAPHRGHATTNTN